MRQLLLTAFSVLFLLSPMDVLAHRFAPSLLQVDALDSDQYGVRWKTPIQLVSDVPLTPILPADCETVVTSPWLQEGTGKIQQSTMRCPGDLVGATFGASGLGPNQASVLLTINLPGGISHQAVLTAESPVFEVPEEPDRWQVVGRYSVLGAEHILAGADHLLFVFGLLLLVGTGRRLVYTITAFTLGHSVTLAMVTLELFSYPVALIEFLIALSIFVLAIELTRERGASRLWRQPWWLAAGFGLLHGMGFAGALAETGLPQANLPLALLFFNIGIELGQLLFIGVLLALWAVGSRLLGDALRRWAFLPAWILGVLSAQWSIERFLEVLA